MLKKFFMLLLAVSLFGAVECYGASESKSKSKKSASKAARQKSRKGKKLAKNKQQRIAFLLRKEFKKIHGLQAELLRNKGNAEKVKEWSSTINSTMKKLAPHLKTLGAVPGSQNMADIDKLIAEGKKLASEPDKVSADTALQLLQEHHLELIEKFRKKVSE
ncbi:MAG: hypothetical protein J6S54_13135 [Lentisphaeria bacterium]|nr:hypothetical protein [Lentisphaeria bacterium]